MNPTEVERYLHEHIPLSLAMGVKVISAQEHQVRLAAPLAPNINHRETVFGGSASALAILSAWTLLYVRCKTNDIQARLVIHKNTMHYDAAMAGDFEACCEFDDQPVWNRFVKTLQRHSRSRISLTAGLVCNDRAAGRFSGDFVGLLK